MAEDMKVVIIGANGTMGAGAACVFAGAGYGVTMLARGRDKAASGLTEVQNDARAEAIGERIALGSYDADLGKTVAEAGLIFEALAEDLPLKKQFFELVDKSRRPDSIIATGSSGLSIAEMARGRSESFRRNFLGIHLFNPPHV
ncbi:MAG TPA: 3-hydroxyacyl-CoA dehydrogenase NAD-binding domain-containing protein, partial [Sporolactobacillaceae bacterium]|nr:3-hydroxyacyl-CoA dehydrogenase NAD-binding domain-containing protein [Sporolactobacillaceae bacterium]